MEIIDFHAHIYPKKIAPKAVEAIGGFYNLKMENDGTAQGLIHTGSKAGISKYVVHSVATAPKQVQSINTFIASACSQHKELVGFGTLHANMEHAATEIERIISLGLKGIKIHPDTQNFNADCNEMFEIYDSISGKLPLLIHCGDYRYDYSHPRRIRNIIDNFPNLTVVAAHFGGWSLWDLAMEYLLDTNCYLDTSSSLIFLGKVRSKNIIRSYGAERLVFGSDFPMWNGKDEVERMLELGLNTRELDMIFHENANRILCK